MGDCPCKVDDIMAKAKQKTVTVSVGDYAAQIDAIIVQMANEEPTGDDRKDAARRGCILKLDAIKKHIAANW